MGAGMIAVERRVKKLGACCNPSGPTDAALREVVRNHANT
jgi:hypothetical protein